MTKLGEESVDELMAQLYVSIPRISDDEETFLYAYRRYVSTWSLYLPIRCVVIGEAPYNKAIYQSTWSAFSYDHSRTRIYTNRDMPPSVEVLASDMSITTGVPFESCFALFRDSWKLVSQGILFVNECVLTKECTDVSILVQSEMQRTYITRLLLDSIDRGQRTIHVMPLGRKADRLATCLISSLEHKQGVKVVRVAACHPAHVFRKNGAYNNSLSMHHRLDNDRFMPKLFEILCGDADSIHLDSLLHMPPKARDVALDESDRARLKVNVETVRNGLDVIDGSANKLIDKLGTDAVLRIEGANELRESMLEFSKVLRITIENLKGMSLGGPSNKVVTATTGSTDLFTITPMKEAFPKEMPINVSAGVAATSATPASAKEGAQTRTPSRTVGERSMTAQEVAYTRKAAMYCNTTTKTQLCNALVACYRNKQISADFASTGQYAEVFAYIINVSLEQTGWNAADDASFRKIVDSM